MQQATHIRAASGASGSNGRHIWDQFDGVAESYRPSCMIINRPLDHETLNAFRAYSVATARSRRAWTFEGHSWTRLFLRRIIFDLAIHIINSDTRVWLLFGRQGVQVESPVEWYNRMRSEGALINHQVLFSNPLATFATSIPGDGIYPRSNGRAPICPEN